MKTMDKLKPYYLIGSNKNAKTDKDIADWKVLEVFESDSDWPEPTQVEPYVKTQYKDYKHVQLVDEDFLVYYYSFKIDYTNGELCEWIRLFPVPKDVYILGTYVGSVVGMNPKNGFYPYKNNEIKSLEFND